MLEKQTKLGGVVLAIVFSIFNNKGGVGKTTYLYHIAHILSENYKVLMVDCDSQCNLTAYTISDADINKAWSDRGNSIYKVIEKVEKGIGDISLRAPTRITKNLHITPGDLFLSNYEDRLGDSWNSAKGGSEASIRLQTAIYRYIMWAAEKIDADVVLVDLGPNLGALNRTVLSGSDYFIVPVTPDLFSIRGTENLGNKLVLWRKEWNQLNENYESNEIHRPKGKPYFLGYVIQQHNIRSTSSGMTRGWAIFGDRLEPAIKQNIVKKLLPLDQASKLTESSGTYLLGKIPNLHSLIPYSLEARKPVFNCNSSDGLKGEHITKAREIKNEYDPIVKIIVDYI